MTFQVPPLPYAYDALEPHISKRTLEHHHDRHHAAYANKLNDLVKDSPLAGKDLEEVIRTAWEDAKAKAVFNNAAQVWNHTFFWNSLTPKAGTPGGDLARKIERDFGSLDKLREKFVDAGVGQFGSGWVWLVAEGDKLDVMATPNAELPMVRGRRALLTCDVWEHAYYLDYQEKRKVFLETFFDKLANWDFAAAQLGAR